MNMYKKACGVFLLAGLNSLHPWQETRTPLSLFEGYMHYPFDRDRVLNESKIDAHFWSGIYFRTAPNAFGNDCTNNQVSDACSSGHKESLAALYFGKSTFTFEESFANSFISQGNSLNPLVVLEPVTINVDYREQGVWFGVNLSTRFGCDDQWSSGLRVRVPFRDIQVSPLCGNPITNADSSNPSEALFQQRVESITVGDSAAQTQNVFAARLDALDILNRVNFNSNGVAVPLVTYPATDILIAGQNASGGVASAGPVTTSAPFLAVIESSDGSVPFSVRWADIGSNGSTVLNSDGSGLTNLQRGRVASDVPYVPLSLDRAAQAQLFVVPNVQGADQATPGALLASANTVYSTLATAFNSLANSSLTDFTNEVGLNACYGNTRGMGDTNFELFIARDWKDYGYFEGRLWLTAPTGIKVYDPLQILKFPTGNNGHAEAGLGLAGGIEKLRYLTFNFDAYYIWVAPAYNNIAAPFTGASIKNIGPCVSGKTSWRYGILDLNMNIVNPCYERMGVMLGYQGYFKSKDHLDLCQSTAIDWAQHIQALNPCVYTQDSDRVAHKIRIETFYAGGSLNVFLGFTATVAGKNTPSEVDFHIGLDARF